MNPQAGKAGASAPSDPGRWPAIQPWLSLIIRAGLAVVFFWSGIEKARDITQSQIAVRAYQLLPDALVNLTGIALPIVELLLAVMLLSGLLTRWAAAGVVVIMVAFIIGIASAWARGLSIDCGCFGGGGVVSGDQSVTYAWEIARDAGLVACAAFLIIWPWSRFSADHALALEPPRRGED